MSVPGPSLGPCAAWITGDDVAACCLPLPTGGPAAFDDAAVEASMLMYELSGRQFSGLCGPVKVRPCRQTCGCWGPSSLGGGPWTWVGGGGLGGAWSWRSECSDDRCGCGTASYVKLAGYPVRQIQEVKIDGAVLDPSEYKLEGWRRLLRTTDPGPPEQVRLWPACQDVGLDDTQPGTFSITYRFGVDPPPLGRSAAAALACELYRACHGGDCQLPTKVVTVARQGVTMQRIVALAAYLRTGATGIAAVDAFVAAYNPSGLRRRPAVFSPDLQRYAKPEGV